VREGRGKGIGRDPHPNKAESNGPVLPRPSPSFLLLLPRKVVKMNMLHAQPMKGVKTSAFVCDMTRECGGAVHACVYLSVRGSGGGRMGERGDSDRFTIATES